MSLGCFKVDAEDKQGQEDSFNCAYQVASGDATGVLKVHQINPRVGRESVSLLYTTSFKSAVLQVRR